MGDDARSTTPRSMTAGPQGRRARTVRVGAVTMFALALTAGVAGCGRAASEAGSTTSDTASDTAPEMPSEVLSVPRASERSSVPPPVSEPPSAPPVSGPKYKLSGNLCRKADLRAIEELFPTQDHKPLSNIRGYCATARSSRDGLLSIGINAELLPDGDWAKRFFDMSRQTATEDVHDIGGAGTEALWTGDSTSIDLTTYHGNLVLEIDVQMLTSDVELPDDMPQRLARVADGTFERLAP